MSKNANPKTDAPEPAIGTWPIERVKAIIPGVGVPDYIIGHASEDPLARGGSKRLPVADIRVSAQLVKVIMSDPVDGDVVVELPRSMCMVRYRQPILEKPLVENEFRCAAELLFKREVGMTLNSTHVELLRRLEERARRADQYVELETKWLAERRMHEEAAKLDAEQIATEAIVEEAAREVAADLGADAPADDFVEAASSPRTTS